jgi:hypothetical protein
MNTRILSSAITLLFCTIFILKVSGQTVAVGHISAEVVEAVSASSSASTDFSLSFSGPDGANRGYDNSAMIAENVSLGSIHISSGNNVACNVTLKPAILSDENGNDFSLETFASVNGNFESQRVEGSQTIELAGMARLNSNQASGLYHGSYTMVFAYN